MGRMGSAVWREVELSKNWLQQQQGMCTHFQRDHPRSCLRDVGNIKDEGVRSLRMHDLKVVLGEGKKRR